MEDCSTSDFFLSQQIKKNISAVKNVVATSIPLSFGSLLEYGEVRHTSNLLDCQWFKLSCTHSPSKTDLMTSISSGRS